MSNRIDASALTPQLLMRAYAAGVFPMAENAEDAHLFWIDPQWRGIFPLDRLIVSRSLAKLIRHDRFEMRVDHDFDAVIDACAGQGIERSSTWINQGIRRLYRALFDMGHVHTIEAWRDGALVGGLYGLAMGGAFFGESMFHRESGASKVALVHLAARLRRGGFALLDTQFVTPHLASLGAVEISRADYHQALAAALLLATDFYTWPKTAVILGAVALAQVRQANA